MDTSTTLGIIGSAERSALASLTLHDLLIKKDEADLARLAWIIYLEASHSAETMGEAIGVDVLVA